ncbi:MAG: D-alanyl-D-alanine carboxypeptidase family protein [Pseudomonadota bacterium]
MISGSIFCAALVIGVTFSNSAYSIEFKAKNMILLDETSRSIMFSRNADEKVAPAALTKLMTLEVVFHALKTGSLSLETEFTVSEHAWRTGGAPSRTATMFAGLKTDISVDDLIRGVTVHAANDAAIILAEGMAESEAAFAERMNERAAAIGLTQSRFTNPTGFEDPEMVVTVDDLARLALHIIEEYPEYMGYFSEPEFTWNKIRQTNKNPLVKQDIGVDGFFLGWAEGNGFAIALTAKRDDQRIVGIMHGLASKKEREAEAKRMIDWAYQSFTPRILFDEGEQVARARVFGGSSTHVPLLGNGAVSILVPNGIDERIRARVVYEGPVRAPVSKGQPIGHVEIWRDDVRAQLTPLYAASDVPVGGLTRRAVDGAQELLFGYW